jgi:hypothetical protein
MTSPPHGASRRHHGLAENEMLDSAVDQFDRCGRAVRGR